MALAVWLKGSQLRWGWGILLMGGEPIKLTELRMPCMERNWQGVLVSGATQNRWGGPSLLQATHKPCWAGKCQHKARKRGILSSDEKNFLNIYTVYITEPRLVRCDPLKTSKRPFWLCEF